MTSEADSGDPDDARTVRVWDGVVRGFHWITVGCFTLAYLFQDPRPLHESLGLTIAAVLAIRVVWGFIGTRHARFADFVPGPSRFFGYVRDAMAGRDARYRGHNPAGGAMVVALMVLLALTAGSGWLMTTDAYFGDDGMEAFHGFVANATVGLVALHLGGVVFESLRHRENLVKAMITGLKRS